jgi:hypothetical protein
MNEYNINIINNIIYFIVNFNNIKLLSFFSISHHAKIEFNIYSH